MVVHSNAVGLSLRSGRLRQRKIGNVEPGPAPLSGIPVDIATPAAVFTSQASFLRPGIALDIRRSAIVHETSIRRPGEPPTQRDPVIPAPPRRLIAAPRVNARVDPGAARRAAVVFELREGIERTLGAPIVAI